MEIMLVAMIMLGFTLWAIRGRIFVAKYFEDLASAVTQLMHALKYGRPDYFDSNHSLFQFIFEKLRTSRPRLLPLERDMEAFLSAMKMDFLQRDGVMRLWFGRLVVCLLVAMVVRALLLPTPSAFMLYDRMDSVAQGIASCWFGLTLWLQHRLFPRHELFDRQALTKTGREWFIHLWLGPDMISPGTSAIARSGQQALLNGVAARAQIDQTLLNEAYKQQAVFRMRVQQLQDVLPLWDFFGNGVLVLCFILAPLIYLLGS